LDDSSQHGLQLRSVGAAGGLAAVAVLVDQLPALLPEVAQTGLPLGGDRETLTAGEGALSLLGGRDAEVDQAAHRGPPGWWAWKVEDTSTRREKQGPQRAGRWPAPTGHAPAAGGRLRAAGAPGTALGTARP